jgi:hypothetical protein
VLRSAPRVRILATSREPLRAEGEWSHRLASLHRRSQWMSSLRLASRDGDERQFPRDFGWDAKPIRGGVMMARIGWVDSARSDSGLTCVISEQHASSGLLSQRSTSKFAAMPVAISGSVPRQFGYIISPQPLHVAWILRAFQVMPHINRDDRIGDQDQRSRFGSEAREDIGIHGVEGIADTFGGRGRECIGIRVYARAGPST